MGRVVIMLKVTITPGNIPASLIQHKENHVISINELPEKIRKRIIETLITLSERGIRIVQSTKDKLRLETNGRSSIPLLPFMPSCLETFELLRWYISPHFYVPALNGNLCAKTICLDCGTEQMMYDATECQSRACTSHNKWAEIYENYTPPDVFNRAWLGIPRQRKPEGYSKV